MNYIWLNDSSPILEQLQGKFNSAIIILNPFIQMPMGWKASKKINKFEHIYPEDAEIIEHGSPINWSDIVSQSELNDNCELALALKTCIAALNSSYSRRNLADKLLMKLDYDNDLFFPNEDKISHFIIKDIIELYLSFGISKVQYSDPIFDTDGDVDLTTIEPISFCELATKEVIITDDSNRIAFMSVYDSFITLLLLNDIDPKEIVDRFKWDNIQCTESTYINWYLKEE
ncbi:DUF2711 domain-containing protein [Paenibacillus sp. SC116]|uniref:DUF2711 domain-containing protein n=1 Tax=Paenibacillus sp. SC116 TaxID=2968986 RepID=UPI00215B51F5|nr:DUF2711 domain-containing protein [Paenibacillus sp. SC116]MCR8843332.1 DUF2711 domain-containing protein [Paenibacillus sp. SC116]